MPEIAFVSAETLMVERRRALVAANPDASGADLVAAIERVEAEARHGEYRDVATGERHVWIDDAPDDPQDGSGHFELYDGSGVYHPTPSLSGRAPIVIEKQGGAGVGPDAGGAS